jgi:hypothetical protein
MSDVVVTVCEQDIIIISSEMGPQGPRGAYILSGAENPLITVGLIGDQYINTTTGTLFGPKTESGWGSGVILGSGLTISDIAYVHYQTSPSATWSITHTLEFTPNIIVVDLDGKVIEGDYQYSGNTINANFSSAITGAAYLS